MISLRLVRELRLSSSETIFLSAASGLVIRDSTAIVVADDDLSLGYFSIEKSRPDRLVPVFPGELPADPKVRKKVKPDFEALFELSGALVAVPSGSRENRVRGARIEGDRVSALDFSPLFSRLAREVVGLNIEGAVATDDTVLLFHRGNSAGSENAVISVARSDFERDLASGVVTDRGLRKVISLPLGEIDGVRLTFGDAARDARGRIWFLASAEATYDAYLDGAYGGAILGRLNSDLSGVSESFRIASPAKPEGLAFDPYDESAFYTVTDADDPTAPAGLFRGRLD